MRQNDNLMPVGPAGHGKLQVFQFVGSRDSKIQMKIRFATNADQNGIAKIIDSVLGEYDDAICLEGAEADLLDVQGNYFAKGGAFWVLEDLNLSDPIVGTHAAIPLPNQANVCTFKRLYLAKPLRGMNWGHQLMQTNIDWARAQRMIRIEFWSDTRFLRAHRFFEKFGFSRSGEARMMDDSHEVYHEYFYSLRL